MQIKIIRLDRFFSSKYKIYVDGKELYYTSSESLNDSHFKLHEMETEITKSILTHEISFFSDSFKIRLFNPDNVMLPFKRLNWFKLKYFGYYNGDEYEIFYLNNNSYLYKNGIEIMNHKRQWNTNSFSFNREYIFDFTDAEDTHLELLVSICLFTTAKEVNSDNK